MQRATIRTAVLAAVLALSAWGWAMSSGQHTPGRAPRLRDLSGSPGMQTVLQHARERHADVRWGAYRGSIRRGIYLASNPGSDKIYRVGGPPGLSLRPGTMVPLGSNTGRPGEVILSWPSPDRRGVSGYPEARGGGSLVFPEPEELTPQPVTGKQYVGLYDDDANTTVYAMEYLDGSYQGTVLASRDYSDQIADAGVALRGFVGYDAALNVVVFRLIDSFNNAYYTSWDLDDNTMVTHDPGGIDWGSAALHDGNILYSEGDFAAERPDTLRSVPISGAGAASVVGTLDDGGDPLWDDESGGGAILPLSSGVYLCNTLYDSTDRYWGDYGSQDYGWCGPLASHLELTAASGGGRQYTGGGGVCTITFASTGKLSLASVRACGEWNHLAPDWDLARGTTRAPMELTPAGDEVVMYPLSGGASFEYRLFRLPVRDEPLPDDEAREDWSFEVTTAAIPPGSVRPDAMFPKE